MLAVFVFFFGHTLSAAGNDLVPLVTHARVLGYDPVLILGVPWIPESQNWKGLLWPSSSPSSVNRKAAAMVVVKFLEYDGLLLLPHSVA